MAKKFAALAATVALLIPLSASAALTRAQADSLVSVVKASPTTATSIFTPLITSFSNITQAQAESLVNVIKASPTAASGPFVDMLLAFTGETACTAPNITTPSSLSTGYSLRLQSPQDVGAGQSFQADQPVTYSSPNLPSWASLSGNKITFNSLPSPGTYAMTIKATNSCGSSDTEAFQVIVEASTNSPSCSAYATPSFAYPGQQFKLNWSSTGMSYTSPYNQTGPTLRYTNHFGTSGVILYGANGSQYYSTDKIETVTFALGLGGFASSQPFIQYCSLNVPIISDGANGAAVITSGNTTAPNKAFSVAGSYGKNGNLLSVVLVPATYSGSRAYSSASSVSGAVIAQTWASYGVWSATFNGLNEAQYTILIYDTSTATPTLLTSGSLMVTAKG